MNELHNGFYLNELYFKYEGPTKDINFNEYYVSKAFFNRIKSLNIKFDTVKQTNKRKNKTKKKLLNKKKMKLNLVEKILNKNN